MGSEMCIRDRPNPDCESSSDESLEDFENPSEDESPTLSFESLSSLALQVHASAIICVKFVHFNERSINVMLKFLF